MRLLFCKTRLLGEDLDCGGYNLIQLWSEASGATSEGLLLDSVSGQHCPSSLAFEPIRSIPRPKYRCYNLLTNLSIVANTSLELLKLQASDLIALLSRAGTENAIGLICHPDVLGSYYLIIT